MDSLTHRNWRDEAGLVEIIVGRTMVDLSAPETQGLESIHSITTPSLARLEGSPKAHGNDHNNHKGNRPRSWPLARWVRGGPHVSWLSALRRYTTVEDNVLNDSLSRLQGLLFTHAFRTQDLTRPRSPSCR